MQTHYDALNVSPEASEAQLRQAYLAAVLQLHPDRQQPYCQAVSREKPVSKATDFARVHEAWQVLKNPSLRSAYDEQLLHTKLLAEVAVSERLSASEMEQRRQQGSTYFYLVCRCGGEYVVQESEFAQGQTRLIVPCTTCSLFIEVVHASPSLV